MYNQPKAPEKMLHIPSCQQNANQNHRQTALHPTAKARIRDRRKQVWTRVWGNGDPYVWPVGMSNGVAALETSPAAAQALKQSYHDPGIPCRVHPRETKTCPRKNLDVDIYGGVITAAQNGNNPVTHRLMGGWSCGPSHARTLFPRK